MYLSVRLPLVLDEAQKMRFLESMRQINAWSTLAVEWVQQERKYNRGSVYRVVYSRLRELGCPAAVASNIVERLVHLFRNKRVRNKRIVFGALKGVPFTHRASVRLGRDGEMLSIRLLHTRETVRFERPHWFKRDWKLAKAGVLVYDKQRNAFYFVLQVEVPEPEPYEPQDNLGVDLGVKCIAATSDGRVFGGDKFWARYEQINRQIARAQRKLKKHKKRGVRRFLKRVRRRRRELTRRMNHYISRRLVDIAKRTASRIVLEDLTGVRDRASASRVVHRWSYFQLRQFILYKAKLVGVPVLLIDPRNTSRTCPQCGNISKKNRPSRDRFRCVACGYEGHADLVAAANIAVAGLDSRQPDVREAHDEGSAFTVRRDGQLAFLWDARPMG